MDRPTPPPEAVLLRLVRTAAGMQSGAAAAEVARRFKRTLSPSRWSQIENGYETRGGEYRPVTANAATLAQMFAVVGLADPERLASEGGRPDAAEILREILRDQPAPGAPRLAAVPEHAPPLLPDLTNATRDLLRSVADGWPESTEHDREKKDLLRQVAEMKGPWEDVLALFTVAVGPRAGGSSRPRDERDAGNAC